MRQRNTTGHVVDVAAHPDEEHPDRHPFAVGPGEVVEFPELLAGFTEVDPPEEQSDPDAEPAAKSTRKRAVAAPTSEGDEQP